MKRNPSERDIWDKAVREGRKEPPVELKVNREEIRKALRESRWQHTRRVKTALP